MNKSKKLYWIDLGLFISWMGLAISGFVMWFGHAEGAGGGRHGAGIGAGGVTSTSLLKTHAWSEVHQFLAIVAVVLSLWHIAMHWSWFVQMTKNVFQRSIKTNRKRR